jgi:endonuclease YncB( thermonuclease family)
MILCYMNPCNINLDWSESQRSDTSKINLNWKIWDHTFVGNNPKALWFDAWTYNVKAYDENNVHQLQLIVLEEEQRSEDKQDVSGSWEINNEEIYDEYLTHALEISAIVANPRWVDSNEYIELHNTWTKDISLRGLIIDDILDAGSKAYVIENDIVLKAGSKKKFYKSLTKLNLNNDWDSVYLHYFWEQIDTLSWDFSPWDNFVITPFNSKIIPQKVLVSRIIDGDTIEIIFENWTKEKLRLVWIDTPEIYNTTDQNEIKHGKRAKSFASEQLYQKSVFFIPEESWQRDTYWRLLWYIQMSDQRIFNQLVIEKWYSRAYLRYPFKYQVAFKKAQTKAKKDKIWIWSDSQFKKIVSKELKLDNEILENSEKTVQYEESLVFYKDQNNDKIPDQFQNSLLNSPDTSTVQEKSSTLNISNTWTTQLEEYQNFVQKWYYIKVSKLLSWIKFSWKTIPNAKIHLELQDKEILIQSSPSWDFEYLLEESFLLWEYTVHSQLTDIFWNKFDIEKEKVFQIDEKYLEKLRISQEKKAIALAKKLEKERLRRLKKLQKSKRATTKKWPKIYSNILISQVQAQSTFNASSKQKDLDILTFIIFILSLFILFHIFRHKKLV